MQKIERMIGEKTLDLLAKKWVRLQKNGAVLLGFWLLRKWKILFEAELSIRQVVHPCRNA